MALAVAQVGGNSSTATNGSSFTFGSTTTTGSLIVVGIWCYNTSGSAAAGDFTDSKSNTYQLAGSLLSSLEGVEMGYNNAGTRGSSHQCTGNAPGANESICTGGVEITGQDTTNSTSCFDSTTFNTANDTTSPFAVTAAAAISGNQIAVYLCSIGGASGNQAVGDPTGYTLIKSQGNANTDLCGYMGYKINVTGTPSPACTWAGTVGSESPREAFASFKEASGAAADTPWNRYRRPVQRPITPLVMRRRK